MTWRSTRRWRRCWRPRPGEGMRFFVRHLAEDLPLRRRVGRVARARWPIRAWSDGACRGIARSPPGWRAASVFAEDVCGALAHAYERWDGKGYPSGLAGEEVPIAIRVVGAARDAELWSRGRDGRPPPRCWPIGAVARMTPRWSTPWSTAANGGWPSGRRCLRSRARRRAGAGADDRCRWRGRGAGRGGGLRRSQVPVLPWPLRRCRRAGSPTRRGPPGCPSRRRSRSVAPGWCTTSGASASPAGSGTGRGPLSVDQWERVRLHPYLDERVLQPLRAAPSVRGARRRATTSEPTAPATTAASRREQLACGRSPVGRRRRLPRHVRGAATPPGAEPGRCRDASARRRRRRPLRASRGRRRPGRGGPAHAAAAGGAPGGPHRTRGRRAAAHRPWPDQQGGGGEAGDLTQDGRTPHRAHLRQGRGHHPRRGDAVRHGARPAVAPDDTRRDGANTRCATPAARFTLSREDARSEEADDADHRRQRHHASTTSAAGTARPSCSCTACAAMPTCGPTRPTGSRTATPACATTDAATPAARRGDAAISDARHADDAAALIEALGLAPCLLVGSSGGAAIAVEVALRHGHLLRGAVFSEPPLFSLDRDAGQALMTELVPRLEQATAAGGPRAGVDAFFSLICPGLWSRHRRGPQGPLPRQRRHRLHRPALPVPRGLDRRPAAVTLPVLVMAGDSSHPSLRSVAHRLAAALPDARLVELADCGHVTYAEQPDAFADAVSMFAAELDARRTSAASARSERRARRFDVRSADGTSLAVWVEGSGPPLVLVHGSIADHTTFDPFVDVLRRDWTTYVDGPPWLRRQRRRRRLLDRARLRGRRRRRRRGRRPHRRTGRAVGSLLWRQLRHGRRRPHRQRPPPRALRTEPRTQRTPRARSRGSRQGARGRRRRSSHHGSARRHPRDDRRRDRRLPIQLRCGPRASPPHTPCPGSAEPRRAGSTSPGQFDAVTLPTLFLAGSESVPVVAKATDEAAAAMPHAHVRVLDGHGHFAHKTRPRHGRRHHPGIRRLIRVSGRRVRSAGRCGRRRRLRRAGRATCLHRGG